MECACFRHGQLKFFDDLRNDNSDGVGGHGEHREHEKSEPLD